VPEAAAERAIHPTAIVMPGAELGPGVEVGPYAVIEPGVEVGAGCRIGPHVHLLGRMTLGPECEIGTGSVLGGVPQDHKYKGERTRVRIGARVKMHEHVTVHRATGEGETVVEDGALLMVGSHVGHNARLGAGATLVNCAALAGHAVVGEKSILSAYCGVHQFGRVGRLTLVTGAPVVSLDAPPFSIVTGSHPTRWRAPNTIGLRRAGFSSEERAAIRQALFRIFAGGERARGVAEEMRSHPLAAVREIAEFVLTSKRGVCAPPPRRSPRNDEENSADD
jgi:UDP-N-acetylglucosamine acyltransferase